MSLFDEAIRRFDDANAQDPTAELVDGLTRPRELVYGERMSACLDRFAPDAAEPVRLAARAQHLCRWRIPRTSYPDGRAGYLKWLTDLHKLHADLAEQILREVGYDDSTVSRVRALLRKRGLRTDPDVQVLEDVICLVFLENYFHDFAKKHDEAKLVSILQKTWRKMTDNAHEFALSGKIALPEPLVPLIQKALSA